MRVIAGIHRGRPLRGPQGVGVRPTSDRVREALFSILGPRLMNSRFLDLYAGTGAVGIEAMSRGAVHVACVESSAQALQLMRRNIESCTMSDRIAVHTQTVAQFLLQPSRWNGPYDIIFADPPYACSLELETLFADPATDGLFAAEARLLVEHAAKTALPAYLGRCGFLRRYRYGDTAVSLYSRTGPAQP